MKTPKEEFEEQYPDEKIDESLFDLVGIAPELLPIPTQFKIDLPDEPPYSWWYCLFHGHDWITVTVEFIPGVKHVYQKICTNCHKDGKK